ncbi:unnamed protein product [Cercopithifilaria johnstoni]|uniref:Uncharacterized protein n=1 Tax=Cercopithifilaria johnstoni TaxID=2874296 RepID=A0A8J2M7Z7_9BILA|nr:unnamed protein product [Cercopithifilaria johnstoni]
MVSTQWSWDSARLIALVLNALYGLEEYYNGYYKDLDVDGLFGLRIIEGHLRSIQENIDDHNIDSEITNEIRNLSLMAGVIANKALPFVANRDREYFNQYQFLLYHPYKMNFTPQRTDERFRWKEKQLKTSKSDRTSPSPALLSRKQRNRCFTELLLANSNLMSETHDCHLSNDCIKRMVDQRGFTGYQLTQQILYIAIALQTSCSFTLSNFIVLTKNRTITSVVTEYCTNMIDELSILLRNPKLTARLNYDERDLLMERIFICGQFGFVELSSLNFFASILSWQNPTSGCFMNDEAGMINDMNTSYGTDSLNLCSTHSATVAAGALAVFLRFLLDRGPWPEYYLADQPVVVYSIAAEDKFRQFSYSRWVRDSFISLMHHGQARPPEIGWSPDLFAYFLVLSIMLGGFMVSHFCYKPKVKQFYHFSYKKL